MIYLNHAGTSWPKPEPVQRAVAHALAEAPETWAARLEARHLEVCRAFGVRDPARLLLTPGATSALSVAVSDHAWEAGDRIVVSGFEHHALYRPVVQLGARGVGVVVLPRAADAPVDLEQLEAELRRGPVRLVAMTAACNVTGERLPIESVVSLARRYGALSLIDGAQVAGWLPIDLAVLGADLWTFTGHKGPQAPWGIGGLFVAPGVVLQSPEARCEIPREGTASECSPMPGYCDVGSVDRSALAGLVAGLRWLEAPERRDRLARAQAQVSVLRDALGDRADVTFHGAAEGANAMPSLALTASGHSSADLVRGLAERGIIASGGIQCAPLAHETLGTAPDGVLRLSFGPMNGDTDAEAAAHALHEILSGA